MLAKRRTAVGLLAILATAVLTGVARMPAESLPKELGKSHSADPFAHGKWPFSPPTRPAVPEVQNKAWVRNPIDALILNALEAKDLGPTGEAEKLTLLRRVTFDLTGLPPTPEEQAAFVADTSADAYEKVVDRLLASPRYGERWAQHWLDVVRYAETDGFKEDAQRPNAYKYRDYVIRAFNADLPYDRFIRQQLAGDELEPDNPEALVATGYCRLYPDEYNAADVRQRRQEILDDVTDTTGLAFLGLTMGCAQCHNHKFDAILQTDYYRLQAFFTPMLPRDDLPDATAPQREEFAKKQAAWEKATAEIRAQIEKLVGPARKGPRVTRSRNSTPTVAKAIPHSRGRANGAQQQIAYQVAKYVRTTEAGAVGKLSAEKKKQYDELEAKLAKFDSLKPAPLPTMMAVTDAVGPPPQTFRLAGGSLKHPAEQVRAWLSDVSRRGPAGDRSAACRPDQHRPPIGARRVAHAQRSSAHCPDHGQSPLAVSFRPRDRRHAERFRRGRRAADASRAARLAGRRVHGLRLEPEDDAPADGHVGHVSAIGVGRSDKRDAHEGRSPPIRATSCFGTPGGSG